jgi:16S rRNA pseudouridine516 synthase
MMTKRKKQRVDKILVHMGIGTRKEVKKLVKSGLVMVNQERISDPGQHIDPEVDQLIVDGEPLYYREHIYLMLNKPAGILSATEDRFGKVVVDLLSPEFQHFSPFPVGRLDKDTEGLLLLTNDGALAHQLLSPKKHVPKTYYAKIEGKVSEEDVEVFRQGVILDDGYKTMPGQLKILSSAIGD